MRGDARGHGPPRMGVRWPGKALAGATGAVALGLLLAACSSGTTSTVASRRPGAGSATTTAPAKPRTGTSPTGSAPVAPVTGSTSPTSSSGSTTTTTTVPAPLAGLVADLLTTADLPSDWSSSGVHSQSGSTTNLPSTAPACLKQVDGIQADFPSLSATFTDRTTGAKLQESLLQTPSAAAASSAYAQLTSAVSSCNSAPAPTGATPSVSVSSLALPKVAQPSTGLSISVHSGTTTINSVAAVGPKGSVIWVVALSASPTPSTTTLSSFTTSAVAKIPG